MPFIVGYVDAIGSETKAPRPSVYFKLSSTREVPRGEGFEMQYSDNPVATGAPPYPEGGGDLLFIFMDVNLPANLAMVSFLQQALQFRLHLRVEYDVSSAGYAIVKDVRLAGPNGEFVPPEPE